MKKPTHVRIAAPGRQGRRVLQGASPLLLVLVLFVGCGPREESPVADTSEPGSAPPVTPAELPRAAEPGEVADAEAHARLAVNAAPPELRENATVLGYTPEGELLTLRRGTNHMICLADKPGDDRFQVACYANSLEPYMARGRQLRAEGMTGPDSINQRHADVEAGTLEMPAEPATVYSLGGAPEVANLATGEVTGARYVYAVYTPYATEESSGLSTTPAQPGAPWIMRPGTATSHIMVTPPVLPTPPTLPTPESEDE